MTQFAFDLPMPIPGLRFGSFVREDFIDHMTMTSYCLADNHDEPLAGHVYEARDGSMLVVVHLGCKITGPNSGSSNLLRIPMGKCDYATAERRLLSEAIAARSNPSLLWSHVVTPASKKIAMANGWWKQEKGEAA